MPIVDAESDTPKMPKLAIWTQILEPEIFRRKISQTRFFKMKWSFWRIWFWRKISRTNFQFFSADDAQAYCNSIGGDLASIYSYNERDFVMSKHKFLKSAMIFIHLDLTMDMLVMPWIGLRRNLTSNSWYNLDGTSFLSWWSSGMDISSEKN